jgi:hypothetical protein
MPAPTYDPNWFYSSLAQSAAGIVGLLGAILTTRLQQQIERATEQRIATLTATKVFDSQLREMTARLSRYSEHAPKQIEELKSWLQSGVAEQHLPAWYSPFDWNQNTTVFPTTELLEVETTQVRLVTALREAISQTFKSNSAAAIGAFAKTVEQVLETDKETKALALANGLRDIRQSATQAYQHHQRLVVGADPTASVVLLICLIVLTGAGLVVPLSFLSAYTGYHRWLLLGLFGIALAGLLIYIGTQIWRLRRLGRFESVLPPLDKTIE